MMAGKQNSRKLIHNIPYCKIIIFRGTIIFVDFVDWLNYAFCYVSNIDEYKL